ncbi:MAG: family 78 glycoside hydrolase catalytic domain, partial [Verrucomicrobiae bacterium]|nr:family 78 glycoside hydrolase catalytic domain [Verrucomicrobiae bacterium]
QVLVASDKTKLEEGIADLWDSGKTTATREPGVRYAGKPLSVGNRCHWKVRCWDASGKVSSWSDPADFEVAPHSPAGWHGARWIDDGGENPERDEDFYQDDPAPLLRHEFNLAKPVVRARLCIAGLGYAYPSINGERIAGHLLDPPWTNFDKRVLFRTHDVTKQLAPGANCLGLTLGNGWFNPLPLRMWGARNIRDALPTGRPRAIALLVAEHPDGTRTIVTTGDGWMTTPGPTLRNSIYLGEVRDARKTLPGWDAAGFKAEGWHPARVTDAPLETLEPLAMPPVRPLGPVRAATVTSPAPGVHIVDFGENLTGVPEVTLDVPAGTRIALRYGEVLHPDGALNPLTSVCGQIKGTRKDKDGNETPIGGPGAPEIAWQQDVYIARGGGPETYRPDFTYHAFRYMEITGLPETPEPADFVAFHLHSDLSDAGSFECSNQRLNRIQEMCRRTFLANVVTVQSDCPHRERFGYGGDIVATSEAFLMNFDMSGFYAKTVRDWADAARPDGNFTDTAPFVGIQYCGVGWAMVHPLLLEQLHTHYGNRRLIEEQLPAAIRWLDLEASKRRDGLVVNGLGDHEALTKSRGPCLTTAMFIDAARRISRLARLVGRDEDAARIGKLADESATAWAAAYLDPATGNVGAGTQSDLTFALGFGAAPAGSRSAVFSRLVGNLTTPADGPRLSTGIFGTRILMEELSQRGRSDLAYALADRAEFPSWGHMLENGATTLWETWKESDNTYSHNHPMFGSVSAWFFRWLGGIQPADDAVGFDRITIRPQVVDGLDWVKSSHRTMRGPVVSNWRRDGGSLHFDIIIPPDTRARIELPAGAVTEIGNPENAAKATSSFEVGSGSYRFNVIPGPSSTQGR